MKNDFISFDDVRSNVEDLFRETELPEGVDHIYLVRDLYGKLRISVSDSLEEDEKIRCALQYLAAALSKVVGVRGYPADEGVLFVSDGLLTTLDDTAQEIGPKIFLADRLVTGRGWWTVGDSHRQSRAQRFTLYSVKGGVGRSTTATVLSWILAHKGEKVLVVDLDLESPGLSSMLLERKRRPQFGVADWFVEDLVGQGDCILDSMLATPSWVQDLVGNVCIVPAHGVEPGEYMAKLGRVYMNTRSESWTARLERLLSRLEERFRPNVILLESRSGLHDIAAATVTGLDANVLLFATDSESTWTDYEMLFRHWRDHGLAERIRERLSIVSALTPELDTTPYLERFRERSWELFEKYLYDELVPHLLTGNEFAYNMNDEFAPHHPLVIHWTRGLAAGVRLWDPGTAAVEQAYADFLNSFERLAEAVGNEGDAG